MPLNGTGPLFKVRSHVSTDAGCMRLAELHELARSGDFAATLAACVEFEGSDEERLEARCIKAWCLSRLGDQAGALSESVDVLEKAELLLGRTHPLTLEALNDVARFSARCGELSAAVAHGQAVCATRKEVLGEHHPKTLTSLANLLRYRSLLGEVVPTSELMLLKAGWQLADPNLLDPAHLNAWALQVELVGDGAGAAACLARFVEVLGEEHPDTVRTRDKLASLIDMG
jgi:hypothetical protein